MTDPPDASLRVTDNRRRSRVVAPDVFWRQHREGLICATLVLVVALVAWLSWQYDADRRADQAPFRASDRATRAPDSHDDTGHRDPTRKPKHRRAEATDAPTLPGFPGAGGASYDWSGAEDLPPSYAGDGTSSSIPAHTLRITVTSAESIHKVGYQVPTSSSHRSGIDDGVGASWGLTTKVYGRPDYARVFLQAGPSGAAITCTITVDGRVTERRSTEGPYGATMCQG